MIFIYSRSLSSGPDTGDKEESVCLLPLGSSQRAERGLGVGRGHLGPLVPQREKNQLPTVIRVCHRLRPAVAATPLSLLIMLVILSWASKGNRSLPAGSVGVGFSGCRR